MKKTRWAALALIAAAALPPFRPGEAAPSAYEQLSMMAQSPVVRGEDLAELFAGGARFAVTDLDGNGRLEIFFEKTAGAGMYPSVAGFEVSGDASLLVPLAEFGDEDEARPQMAVSAADAYCNPDDGAAARRYYHFDTETREAPDKYHTARQLLSLKDGAVKVETVAFADSVYEPEDDDELPSEPASRRYYNWRGEETDEAMYSGAIADYIPGCESVGASFNWLPSDELFSAASDDYARELLAASWSGFSFGEAAGPSEDAPVGEVSVDPSIRQIGLYKKTQRYSAFGDNGKIVFRQSWPELFLTDGDGRSMLKAGSFPRLAIALADYNAKTLLRETEMQDAMREGALEELEMRIASGYPDSFLAHYSDSSLIIKRADSLALSFVEARSSFTGGAHGMYSFTGVNFDPSTGKRLSLHDVFIDADMLMDTVMKKLRAKCGPALFDSAEDTVAKGILDSTLMWTLGPRCVTFYFNPYDVAPYASGLIEVNIFFGERPGLFNEKYKLVPASYCEELPVMTESAVLLSDSGGRADKLSVDYEDGRVAVNLNGKAYRDPEPLDGMAKPEPRGIIPVFVHTGGGQNLLYVDIAGRGLRIYELSGGGPSLVNTDDHSFRRVYGSGEDWTWQWVMTDPYEFRIDNTYPSEDRVSKSHVVGITENGEPDLG